MKFTIQKIVLPFKLPMQGKTAQKDGSFWIDPSFGAGIQGRGFEPPFLFWMSVHDLHQLQKEKTEQYVYTI